MDLEALYNLSNGDASKPAQNRTTVVHVRDISGYDVYIGRGKCPLRGIEGKWGNPFSHKPSAFNIIPCATREEAIARYQDYLLDTPELLDSLDELRGKRLGCFCRPNDGFGGRLMCHGQILAGLVDGIPPESVE